MEVAAQHAPESSILAQVRTKGIPMDRQAI
jgi:hypothetical protein